MNIKYLVTLISMASICIQASGVFIRLASLSDCDGDTEIQSQPAKSHDKRPPVNIVIAEGRLQNEGTSIFDNEGITLTLQDTITIKSREVTVFYSIQLKKNEHTKPLAIPRVTIGNKNGESNYHIHAQGIPWKHLIPWKNLNHSNLYAKQLSRTTEHSKHFTLYNGKPSSAKESCLDYRAGDTLVNIIGHIMAFYFMPTPDSLRPIGTFHRRTQVFEKYSSLNEDDATVTFVPTIPLSSIYRERTPNFYWVRGHTLAKDSNGVNDLTVLASINEMSTNLHIKKVYGWEADDIIQVESINENKRFVTRPTNTCSTLRTLYTDNDKENDRSLKNKIDHSTVYIDVQILKDKIEPKKEFAKEKSSKSLDDQKKPHHKEKNLNE